MGLHVAVQIEFCEETSIAVLAEELFLALMNHKMLVQVGFLSKRMVTPLERAVIWSFAGMNSKMVEEIVPFSEYFLAVSMGA